MITRRLQDIPVSDHHALLPERLLTVTIYAGTLRAAIDQSSSESERQELTEQLKRAEMVRQVCEDQLRAVEQMRSSWWQGLWRYLVAIVRRGDSL